MNASSADIGPSKQLATFYIAGRLYGIDVMRVQEVTQAPRLTIMPLAPVFVRGLINLRGQIATAIGLRELFGAPSSGGQNDLMTIVCQHEHTLLSLLVDQVGDVIEIRDSAIEPTPSTIDSTIKTFMHGVCMHHAELLSIIDIKKVTQVLNSKENTP